MTFSRLTLAFGPEGARLPDDGQIAVFRPRTGYDLTVLPKTRVKVVQGFFPDHQSFFDAGYAVTPATEETFAAAVIALPRVKAEARALVFQAAALVPPGGLIVIDGNKTDGIESLLNDVRRRVDIAGSFPKAHGRVFWFAAEPVFDDWAPKPLLVEGGFQTVPGIFSSDAPDRASAILAENLPRRLPGRVMDLGAGWGFLARAVLARTDVEELHLIEAEHAALACARLNVTDPRARFHWADARNFQDVNGFDVVVTNPPFHNNRAGDPALGQAFIAAAARLLRPQGEIWLVANRHLPYETALAENFRDQREVAGTTAFKIIHAGRPRRKARIRG